MKAIRWYQHHISAGTARRCRYEPTCSAYAIEAVEIHGAIKGSLLALWRVVRCNPFSNGGVDWVPPRGQWPSKPMGYEELMAYRKQHDHEMHDRGEQGTGGEGSQTSRQ
ncbi:MAG: membrane protein insertion efficiency factor YidD [Actinomycetaceae bacterium]|nr:membrane protein insertion efficiency factor YidD [Arcanobacterium sp.]MDD7505451.1 membrane protein insertion efficiency factor YidD [Actinomycetaceae bacterium]